MNLTSFHKNAIPLNQYLVILSPDVAVSDKLLQLKEGFAKEYNFSRILSSKPHITLVKFVQSNLAEERILNRIENIISTQSPFQVRLTDFGSFPTHSIYINITSKESIKGLITQLKPLSRWMRADKEYSPHFITDPNLMLARKLQASQYEKAWIEYSNSSFSGMFMAHEVQVLKRPLEAESGYKTIGRFAMKSKATHTSVQTLLF